MQNHLEIHRMDGPQWHNDKPQILEEIRALKMSHDKMFERQDKHNEKIIRKFDISIENLRGDIRDLSERVGNNHVKIEKISTSRKVSGKIFGCILNALPQIITIIVFGYGFYYTIMKVLDDIKTVAIGG